MKKKNTALKVLLAFLLIVVVAVGGVYFLLKTPKNIGVSWTEKDYQSYVGKVKREQAQNGEFNLLGLANGRLECKGSINLNVALTNEEVSSALSKENNQFGPIRDVKVRFLGNNEAEATFVLTEQFSSYISANEQFVKENPLYKQAMSNTPIYIKAKVNKQSSKSISADVQNISIGNIPLTDGLVNTIEKRAVPVFNNLLNKYDPFSIDELKFEKDKLVFKGVAPERVTVSNK